MSNTTKMICEFNVTDIENSKDPQDAEAVKYRLEYLIANHAEICNNFHSCDSGCPLSKNGFCYIND